MKLAEEGIAEDRRVMSRYANQLQLVISTVVRTTALIKPPRLRFTLYHDRTFYPRLQFLRTYVRQTIIPAFSSQSFVHMAGSWSLVI
jgi:hypothetical protein